VSTKQLEQVDLNIGGMTCSSCVATVERALNKVPGVQATVNLATETAHILAPEEVKTSELIDAVKKSGYEARLRTDESESFSNTRGLGIRVLLALVLTIPVIAISMWHDLHHRVEDFLLNQLQNFGLPLPLYSATAWLAIALSTPVVLFLAWPIHRAALRNFTHPTMDNLISVGSLTAFIWSIYANSTGAGDIYAEVAATVVTLIMVGRYLEARAKKNAGSALANLLSLNSKEVTVANGILETITPIAQVRVGDHCVVRPGDRIPVDGVIVKGTSALDTSFVTGESLPVDVSVGDLVMAGSINRGGRLVVEAQRVGSETELSRITKMVLTAQTEKAPIQRLADRISSIFVPIVFLLSIGTLITWLATGASTQKAVSAAVALLVIACPCALGLATPVALLVASGRGARKGIVLRKPRALELAPKIDTIVFDKTGTITSGSMQIMNSAKSISNFAKLGISDSEAQSAIFTVARESNHPVARAVSESLSTTGVSRLDFSELQETSGVGVAARVTIGQQQLPVIIGSPDAVRRATLNLPHEIDDAISHARRNGNSVVVVAIDGLAISAFEVGDRIKEDAAAAISEIRSRGITTWLISGDNENTSRSIASQVGIPQENVIASASPEMKIEKVKELRADGASVLMIGDGVNDAAALAEADLSIAMGTGTDTAISVADITLMRPNLGAVIESLDLSRRTLQTIRMNLGWAFVYNVIGMPIAALGYLNPMISGGAMALSSLFVVMNSLRIARK
jgi:Cu+-exporting ATPase